MTPDDFRRIALSFAGTEEGSHLGAADFRVGGHIFATLAMEAQGYGNIKLTPLAQQILVTTRPDLFFPIPGGWGRMGITHVRLAETDEEALTDALRIAWEQRCRKNLRKKKR